MILEQQMKNFIILCFIWNIFVFLLYGFDKYRAKKSRRRISEKSLIIIAFFQGAIGAMFAMVIFNHKTSKAKFRILVPLFVIKNVLVFYTLINYLK